MEHIEAQLDPEGRRLFRELTDHYGNVEEDHDVAQAKLAGQWPGWEWLMPDKADAAFEEWFTAFLDTPEGQAVLRKAGL